MAQKFGYLRDITTTYTPFEGAPGFKAASGTADYDLRPYCTPSNQYDIGSCFPEGTPILMGDLTERRIEQVAVGNVVVGHDGKQHTVLNTFQRKYTGKLYKIKAKGWAFPLILTDNHPVAQILDKRNHPRKQFRDGGLVWTEASELSVGDLVMVPDLSGTIGASVTTLDVMDFLGDNDLIEEEGKVRTLCSAKGTGIPRWIEVSQDFMRLLGLFTAEGSYTKVNGNRSGVRLSFHRNEKDLHKFTVESFDNCFGLAARTQEIHQKANSTDIRCDSVILSRLFYVLVGEYAIKKSLDPVLFSVSREAKIAFLRGWFEGDGSHEVVRTKSYKTGERRVASLDGTTSSDALLRSLSYMLLSCGIKPQVSKRKQASHQNAPAGIISLYSNRVKEIFPDKMIHVENSGTTWTNKVTHGHTCKVTSIETIDVVDVDVFNFEVEGVNSYIANGIAVHNCAGNATADAVEILDAVAGKPVVQLSRLFVYSMARILHQQLNMDEGTYIASCFEVLSRFGICSETVWPYDTSKVFVAPSLKAERDARAHKIHSYYKITAKGRDRIPQILAALANKCPVVFGTLVAKGIGSHQGEDILDVPQGEIAGGHAMIIVGYDSSKKAFIIKNSWGSGWGMSGFAYFSEDYICWDETWDMWVPFGGYTDG